MTANTRSPRIHKLSFISFVEKEAGEQKSPVSMGRTINVSATGVGIESYQEIASGTVMEMDIGLGEEIIHVRGKVVRVNPLEDGGFFLGIVFDTFQERLEAVVLEKG